MTKVKVDAIEQNLDQEDREFYEKTREVFFTHQYKIDGVKDEDVLILDAIRGDVLVSAVGFNYALYYTRMDSLKAKIMLNSPTSRVPD